MIEGTWLGRIGRHSRGPALSRTRRWLPRRTTVVAVLALVLVLGGAWLWLRDSSLVAVKRVSVTGVSGPDADRIRAALRTAALNMTTLDVHENTLNTVVQPFPVVKGLQVSTQFPHGMTIRVIEQVPVGALSFGGRRIAVAGDGTLLHDVRASASLPVIPVRVAPGGTRVSDRASARAVAVLAAAPYALLTHVTEVTTTTSHGLVAQLRSGPSVYFGSTAHLHEKWAAAAAVLADGGSAGALYIDVTDPQRPAAGSGSSSGSSSSAAGASASAATSTAATSAPAAGLATTTSAVSSVAPPTTTTPGAAAVSPSSSGG